MYTATIGLEVHVELKTKTKMFCGSKNDPHHGEPNTHICPVCVAHPGTLPVINKEAVRHVLKVGIALDGDIASFTEFDRKNYFYPDIPKGYQISQYKYPLVSGGKLAGVDITRVHLEEDTARSLHDQGEGSIIDYNRAGVPLMELVTEPVIHDAETAGKFARELQLLLRTLEVSDANLDRGEMRVEVNISVSKDGTLGTKVEVKNLNSFKAVEGAIAHEIKRQSHILDTGGQILQETRGWDEQKSLTFSQRLKETSEEYRYFPDPDLPKLDILKVPEFSLSRIKEEMPELPEKKRLRYGNLGLPIEQIDILISDKTLSPFFEKVIAKEILKEAEIKKSANYLTSDVLALMGTEGRTLGMASVAPFCELMTLITEGTITSRVAKDILAEVIFEALSPRQIAEERGLLQQNDTEALTETVRSIIAAHPSVVKEYRGGKETVLKFLVGQGMKETKGSANPSVLEELLKKEIGS